MDERACAKGLVKCAAMMANIRRYRFTPATGLTFSDHKAKRGVTAQFSRTPPEQDCVGKNLMGGRFKGLVLLQYY